MLPASLMSRKPQLVPFTCSTCTILLSSVAARAHPQLYASAGDKFSLNDDQEGGGELLTHMGRSLGAGDTHEVIFAQTVTTCYLLLFLHSWLCHHDLMLHHMRLCIYVEIHESGCG